MDDLYQCSWISSGFDVALTCYSGVMKKSMKGADKNYKPKKKAPDVSEEGEDDFEVEVMDVPESGVRFTAVSLLHIFPNQCRVNASV